MKSKVLSEVRDYVILTLACLIYAIAWECFMIPNGMSAGGLMGLCTVVQYATAGILRAQVLYVIINVFLIGIAALIFGLGFGFKTIYCIAATTLFMQLCSSLDFLFSLPDHFFYIREPFIIPIVAGILEAFSIGLIIRKGGSTGGTDIVALMVNKYWPISLSKVFLWTDFFIILLILSVPGKSFCDIIYGFEMMITFSLMVDRVIGGSKDSMQVMVFSKKYAEIADHVINSMDHGATILRAQGWYTKMERDVLMILIRRNELPGLTSVIKQIDPTAFMSVSQTSSVYGEGFEEIKTGIDRPSKKSRKNDQN